jgi:hypothetical protein
MVAADVLHKAWGTRLSDEFSYKLHPTRDGGAGNPLLFWRHPGGGSAEAHLELWDQGGGTFYDMTKMLEYLFDPAREVHFDVVSVESPQVRFDTTKIPLSMRSFCPSVITGFQRSIRNASMIMKDLGSDPERKGIMCASHGSWIATMSMLWQPEFGGSGQRAERRGRFETRGYNSKFKFGVLSLMAYPDWRKLCKSDGITFTGTIAGGPSAITATGMFAHYRYTAGDTVIFTTAGGVSHTATVAAKTSNNIVTLTASLGLSGAVSGFISTDQVDPSWAGMLFGTKAEDAPDAFGNPDYRDWDALPQGMREAVSPMYWAEQNLLNFVPPTYFISNLAEGNGVHPYGNSYDPTSAIHDYNGAIELSNLLRSHGKSSTWEGYPDFDGWTDYSIPARLYNWMVNQLEQ